MLVFGLCMGVLLSISLVMVGGIAGYKGNKINMFAFLFAGVLCYTASIFISLTMCDANALKYVPNLYELVQEGKVLEAQMKLEEMKNEI